MNEIDQYNSHCERVAPDQRNAYHEDGVLILDNLFSDEEINLLSEEVNRLKELEHPGRVIEERTGAVRALNGPHLSSEILSSVVTLDRMLDIAKVLLKDDVYLYQFKVNFKEPFDGEIWEWHQDFPFWHYEDGMPEAESINICVFLDEVTEFNGPLILMPGTQRLGMIRKDRYEDRIKDNNWSAGFGSKLKFSLDRDVVDELAGEFDMLAPKGPRGSAMVFSPNTVHGSAPNMSPFGRRMLIITYNSVRNAPDKGRLWRPEFVVGRDVRPLSSIRSSLFE